MTSPRFTIFLKDTFEWLKTLGDASVDLIVTDPAYSSLEKHRAKGTTTRLKVSDGSSNEWFAVIGNDRLPELLREFYRVLKPDRHCYVFTDPDTLFHLKPAAEAARFEFRRLIVWDKCLHPDTHVLTGRGTITLRNVERGDTVRTPSGHLVEVLATRRTRARTLRLGFSDGTAVTASPGHRFVREGGAEVEACELLVGDALSLGTSEDVQVTEEILLNTLLSDDERVLELPDSKHCLFCNRSFETARGASTHQARQCAQARSKKTMAAELKISPRRLRRWMAKRALPATWARVLGLEHLTTGRFRQALANNAARTIPEVIRLDYAWGRFVGLYAAEGSFAESGVVFAFHEKETLLHAHIARMARSLGLRARIGSRENTRCVVVYVSFIVVRRLIETFVGGTNAVTKHFRPAVYAAPRAFRDGVLDGLLEGDGSWSHDEQRTTLNVASVDLAHFALRELRHRGYHATLRPFSNDHASGFRVRCDPQHAAEPLTITSIESGPEEELIDIAINDEAQLFLLANGLTTHNCQIGMGYGYRRRTEFVLFLLKGKRRVADLGISDLLTSKRVSNGYPTEKPVDLLEIFIKQSAKPDELVIDPFLGSGSTGVATLRHGCRFAGCDISPKSIATAMPRLVAEDGRVPIVEMTPAQFMEVMLTDSAPRPPRVWNQKLSAEIPGGAVYVGRRPSKWGNPIHLQSERGRESVLQRYEEWLMTQPELIAAARVELRGKDLVCHCAPKPCHADILLRIANSVETEEEIEHRMRLTEPLRECACDGTGECSWCERGVEESARLSNGQ